MNTPPISRQTVEEAYLEALQFDFPDIEPLPGGLPDVWPFSFDLLPSTLAPYCRDVSDRLQCAPDYVAVGLMVALGSVIGRSLGIYPKQHDDWLVVPNLWGGIVGRPSLFKSPALAQAIAPLTRLEQAAANVFTEEQAQFKAEQFTAEIRQAEVKKLAKTLIKKGKEEEAVALLAENLSAVAGPVCRRYKTNDATVEKLGELLADNPRGLLVFRDELMGWLTSMDKEGREGDRSFYLEAFNGVGSFTYDRIGRGTVKINACTVSILGGIQPSKLDRYVRQALGYSSGNDGLMQRFQLLVWPDKMDWKFVNRAPNKVARQQVDAVFERLAGLRENDQSEGASSIPAVRFDDTAQHLFNEWYIALMEKVRDDDLPDYLQSHLGKYASLMPALALIIHLAEQEESSVSEAAVRRAIGWCDYLESHARRVYAPGLYGAEIAAMRLAKRIASGVLGLEFTLRDVYRKGWEGLGTTEEAKGAIDVLLEHNWLVGLNKFPEAGGRPTKVYIVNPKALEQ